MTCKIHKIHFYKSDPLQINCIAYSASQNILALSRKDASIEIWDIKHSPFLVNAIPGVEDGSVEALCWVEKRLLSTGLAGALVEWCLNTLQIKASVLLTGNAAWCMDVNVSNSQVAVGTEQGYVNLYSVKDDCISYEMIFDKQEGRIICCKFDKSGEILVTGSEETIRIWNVKTGHAMHRMSVKRRKETIVWCLAVLADLTIVSGDSKGYITFWDGNIGEQIESFPTHRADILSLCVAEDEQSLYCAGVDPIIASFARVPVRLKDDLNAKKQWIKSMNRNIHQHDVRALALQNGKLISVGSDGYIAFSSYPPKQLMRVPPLIPSPRLFVCKSKRLLLLRYRSHLEVWRLGEPAKTLRSYPKSDQSSDEPKDSNGHGETEQDTAVVPYDKENACSKRLLNMSRNPVKLLSLRNKGQDTITCCGISPNGQWLAYSTDSIFRIFSLSLDKADDTPTMAKVRPVPEQCKPCQLLAFSKDSKCLVLGTSDGTLTVVQLRLPGIANYNQTIHTDTSLKNGTLLHLDTALCKKSGSSYIVAANCRGGVGVWTQTRDSSHYVVHAVLPKRNCCVSALAVSPNGDKLVITYVDQTILEYFIAKKCFTKWSSSLPQTLPTRWYERNSAVTGIEFDPRNKNVVIMYDTHSLWVINKDKCETASISKQKKLSNGHIHELSHHNDTLALTILPYKYIAGFSWIEGDEALIVEISPESIMSQLPPVLSLKRIFTQ